MVQTWFWFGVGFAYVFFGIFNCYLATRLRPINILSLARYHITDSEEERERLSEMLKQMTAETQKLFDEGKKSREELQLAIDTLKEGHKWLGEMATYENLNKAFDNIESFADEFNKATKANRYVLYAAAVSFFFAAVISFGQGALSI